jgi:hypothetical protein
VAEGGKASFGNCVQKILGLLGEAEAYPDADPNIIASARELFVPAAQQAIASQDPMAQLQSLMGDGGAPQGPPAPGGPPGGPMEMEQAMTRLPRMRGNPLEQGVALERQLSPEMGS